MDRNQAKHPDRRQAAAVAPTRTTVEPDSEHLKNTRIVSSLARSQAVIEFDPTGTILDANNNFLGAMGYRLDEIRGQHHRMFVDPTYANSAAYEQFWEDLRGGTFLSAEFLRFGKGGREVWIQATYNPVVDASGNVDMIIKFATDITQQKLSQKEIQDRSQAVIEFEPDGTIITANELFLSTVGFTLDQIKGKHHAIFMPPGEAETAEYQALWPSLARGDFRQGEFHRVTSRGDDLWLQGAYNPVLDSKGQVIRVMKTVTNITEQVENKSNASRIGNTIAAAVTQMTGAISEISENVIQNADLAKGVESDASKAAEMASELNDNSSTIGQVVNVIQDLAGQTNLLALNATIEAARAGESGRGFAIVANEVKNLATQTNEATAEIRASVEAIQYDVSLVVDAIQGILNGVADVSTNTGTIAAAIEEQSVVMGGINSTADELLALNAMD